MQVSVIETLLSASQRLHVRILIKIVIIKENSKHRWTIRIRKRQEPLFFFSFPFPLSSMHLPFALSPASLQHNEACAEAGADPGFFLGGSALISCSTSTPINHIVFFFCRIPVVLENHRSSRGRGGGELRTPCTLPWDPPLGGSCSSCSEESPMVPITMTPNNTKTIERMTCHCFLLPIEY